MDERKIQRINELAKKAKTVQGLTPEEKEEQALLRRTWMLCGAIWRPNWTIPTFRDRMGPGSG